MTIASVGTLGTGARSSNGTNVSVTTSAAVEVGNLAVLIVALDNNATTDGDFGEVTSVTDSRSNTWTKLAEHTNGQGAASAGVTVSTWYCIPTTQIQSSDTITANFGHTVSDAAATAWEFTIGTATVAVAGSVQVLADDAGDAGGMTISGLSSAHSLFLRSIGAEHEFTTFTPTTSYTQFTARVSTTTSSADSNIAVLGEFRILTGTGDSSDPTASSSYDYASTYLALREVSGATYTLTASHGAYSNTGQSVTMSASRVLTASHGAYSNTGQSVTMSAARVLTASHGAYSQAGQSASLFAARSLLVNQADYALGAQSVDLLAARVLVASHASHAITGQAATLSAARQLAVTEAAYTLTPQSVDMTYTPLGSYVLDASPASHAITGQAATLSAARQLAVTQAAYTIAPQSVDMTYTPVGSYLLDASPASYTDARQSAGLLCSRLLQADPATYTLAGQLVAMTYSPAGSASGAARARHANTLIANRGGFGVSS